MRTDCHFAVNMDSRPNPLMWTRLDADGAFTLAVRSYVAGAANVELAVVASGDTAPPVVRLSGYETVRVRLVVPHSAVLCASANATVSAKITRVCYPPLARDNDDDDLSFVDDAHPIDLSRASLMVPDPTHPTIERHFQIAIALSGEA
jgi:hypothetical protein